MRLLASTVILISAVYYVTFHCSHYLKDVKIEIDIYSGKPRVSSVACHSCSDHLKCCQFENLYYFPDEQSFVFVLHETSRIYGIKNLQEFNSLSVSSIENHTNLVLPLTFMTIDNKKLSYVWEVAEPVFLLHRFKPDNIMHVLHDDLLPLFARLDAVCFEDSDCLENFRLAFIDPLANDPRTYSMESMYQLFSKEKILKPSEPVMYLKALTGLPSDTVGYQYGFKKTQGPLPLPPHARGIFQRFASAVRTKLQVVPGINTVKRAVYIQRSESRRILNEKELQQYILKAYKARNLEVKMFALNLKVTTDLTDIISVLSDADLIFGIHGAAMYLAALFCKPGSVLVEIFPYGIQASVVSPVQSLANLPNSWFMYGIWENQDPEATVPPDVNAHPLLGGLSHLSLEEQQRARETVPVPAVQCCHNATYLYRMFQDTKVGPQFQNYILDLLIKTESANTAQDTLVQEYFLPGPVISLYCRLLQGADNYMMTLVDWQPPFNIPASVGGAVSYDISLTSDSGEVKHFQQRSLNLEVSEAMSRVWVKACLQDKCGRDSFIDCHVSSSGVDWIKI